MIENIEQLLDNITPPIYQQLKKAVELGKWPTGQTITKEQRALCMQAVIAYEKKNIKEEERSGYVPPKKTPCATDHSDLPGASSEEQILDFKK